MGLTKQVDLTETHGDFQERREDLLLKVVSMFFRTIGGVLCKPTFGDGSRLSPGMALDNLAQFLESGLHAARQAGDHLRHAQWSRKLLGFEARDERQEHQLNVPRPERLHLLL